MTEEQVNKTISDCASSGFGDITIKDVSFFLLKRDFKNAEMAFDVIYGDDITMSLKEYESREDIQFLRNYMNSNFNDKDQTSNVKNKFIDITFEENKEALIKYLNEVEEAQDEGLIKLSDALKIKTDIRIKLNDKFNISDQSDQHYIIVQQKFNDICPYCNHEIAIPTKEELMKKYNLIERK